jgi:hypothetical protein
MAELLAPNGKPSNLSPEQYELVRTPAFKQFFGDWENLILTKINDSGIDEVSLKRLEDGVSKVVDENGEPLPVYHGTDVEFSVFKNSDIGSHFGTSEQAKRRVYGNNKAFVKSFYLNVKNPLKLLNFDYGNWSGSSLALI